MAHAAAGGTLQERMKTAAGENATTRTLGEGLGYGFNGRGSGGGDCTLLKHSQPFFFPVLRSCVLPYRMHGHHREKQPEVIGKHSASAVRFTQLTCIYGTKAVKERMSP